MKCRGGAELPHPHPPTLGGFIHRIIPCSRMEEEEEEALLLPINSLPFSPRCHSLFFFSPCPPWLLHVRLTRRPHVLVPGVG